MPLVLTSHDLRGFVDDFAAVDSVLNAVAGRIVPSVVGAPTDWAGAHGRGTPVSSG